MAAKAFALVGEGDNYGNVGSCGGDSPMLIGRNPSSTLAIINSLHSPENPRNKMVRKRTSSKMELHIAGNVTRFPRRTATAMGSNDYGVGLVVNSPNPTPPQVPNYFTMTMMLLSSTNFNITMTSDKSGSGSDTALAFSNSYIATPVPPLNNYTNSTSSLSSQSFQTPFVCVFSGLSLFPPNRSRGATSLQLFPAVGGCSSLGMEDTTGWIDGIIKDLIHSSIDVSIPQLILNVTTPILPPSWNIDSALSPHLLTDRRRKEALPPLPSFQCTFNFQLHP